VPPFGRLWVDPVSAAGLPVMLLPASGVSALRFAVPADATLVGVAVHFQGLVVPSAQPASWRLTNPVTATVHR
jgi:hypothetical protein